MADFSLSDNFIDQFKNKKPNFGFNGLGELVYRRTYSRLKENGDKEEWWETVRRVVEGTYNMQKEHVDFYNLGWNPWKAQKSAQEMFTRIFEFKFLPPGRGLWLQGSKVLKDKGLYIGLINCAFISTEEIEKNSTLPFEFVMDSSMLGVGVGFDTKGEGGLTIQSPSSSVETFTIPDTREGWVESLRLLLESYFVQDSPTYEFDYSNIRPQGSPIRGFGGIASGPKPLMNMHKSIRHALSESIDKPLSSRNIVDIMNFIGKAVVAGNVRRTALLALGEYDDEEYLDLKDYEKNPERESFGWSSNNSIYGKLGQDYSEVAERIKINGEPGIFWLNNARNYGRLSDGYVKDIDGGIMGVNPCGEIGLESQGICNLVETFPNNHDSIEDYLKTLKYAYLYSKTVTLANTHWVGTNRIILRTRRIGCSVTGVAQFLANRGIEELRRWLNSGYSEVQRLDKVYSDWLAIPQSIKTTTVKPSGTTSLLAGATPGMHFPESRYYIRRMRLGTNSDLVPALQKAGYHIEPAFGSEDDTVVVEIPVFVGDGVKTLDEVNMWEQLSLASFLQEWWADNQVSCTVTFDPDNEGDQIEDALDYFQYKLKSISFLPRLSQGAYRQMPYERISKEEYEERTKSLLDVSFSKRGADAVAERFCDGDTCTI